MPAPFGEGFQLGKLRLVKAEDEGTVPLKRKIQLFGKPVHHGVSFYVEARL